MVVVVVVAAAVCFCQAGPWLTATAWMCCWCVCSLVLSGTRILLLVALIVTTLQLGSTPHYLPHAPPHAHMLTCWVVTACWVVGVEF